jgi:DNA-binding transcriptional LysR family regulator
MARATSVEPRGVLRLLTPPSFATHLLVPCLAAFRRQCPDVSLCISHQFVDTASGDFDVSIIYSADALEGDFVAHKLVESKVTLCASPSYLARHGTPQTPDDLARHDCLVATSIETFRQWHFSSAANNIQVEPRASLSAPLVETVCAAARGGVGIASLPRFMVEQDLADGTLVALLPDWAMRSLGIHAAVPTRKHLPARTRALLDHLRATFAGDAPSWSQPLCRAQPLTANPAPARDVSQRLNHR